MTLQGVFKEDEELLAASQLVDDEEEEEEEPSNVTPSPVAAAPAVAASKTIKRSGSLDDIFAADDTDWLAVMAQEKVI